MKPLFTIHEGEYLVGLHIERHFRNLNVWIPTKDTGIDLLVSDRQNRKTASVQVKFGKDFLPEMPADLQKRLRVYSWFTINRSKLDRSVANFWVFVLYGFKSHAPEFVVVPTPDLRQRLERLHGAKVTKIQSYLCITEHGRCWESRGLQRADNSRIAAGEYDDNPDRDFTRYLNQKGWEILVNNLSQTSLGRSSPKVQVTH